MSRAGYGFLQLLPRASVLRGTQRAHDERNRFGKDFMLCIRQFTNGARWRLPHAASPLIDSHDNARPIIQETTRQMPTTIGKALHGGRLSHG